MFFFFSDLQFYTELYLFVVVQNNRSAYLRLVFTFLPNAKLDHDIIQQLSAFRNGF